MALISVIIPVYNHATNLARCLSSLKRQTFQDFETIIVDDGSSVPVEQATVRFEVNRGAPAARNEGFRRSSGAFVIFLDADAELKSDALAVMLQTLLDHPETAFAYPSFYWGWKLFRGQPFDVHALRKRNYIHTSALIRREAFCGFDESLKKFQDWDLFLTLAAQGKMGIWIDRALFRLTQRRDGMSTWLPSIVHRLPWPILGWMPHEIRRARMAEAIIRQKHGL
jgi:glycosyltransferase involved in cell wall biosynthesis